MGLLEHRCLLSIMAWDPLPAFSVFNAKLVLEVTHDPHLADDVLVKRVVGRLEELDDEARDCSASSDMNVMNEKTFKRTYSEQQSR